LTANFCKHIRLRFLSITILISIVSACTWVKPIENASDISLISLTDTASCKVLGNTNVSVKDRVGILKRGSTKVAEELTTLAKNAAVNMGGNSIAAKTEVNEGQQEFGIYQCNPS